MPIEDRPQGFLARLNTAQRVILFITGLVALGLIAFPKWTCGDGFVDSYWNNFPFPGTPDFGRYFLFDQPEKYYSPIVNVPRLLGELLVPLAIGALGYFVFKTPVAAAPSAATPAPPPQEPQAAAPTAPTTGGDLV